MYVFSWNAWRCCCYGWIWSLMEWKWTGWGRMVEIGGVFLWIKPVWGAMLKTVVGMSVYWYWFLHGTLVIHWQTDAQNLPPTISSLRYKISKFLWKPRQARVTEMLQKNVLFTPNQTIMNRKLNKAISIFCFKTLQEGFCEQFVFQFILICLAYSYKLFR